MQLDCFVPSRAQTRSREALESIEPKQSELQLSVLWALCRGLVEWGRAIQARNYPARHVLSGRN